MNSVAPAPTVKDKKPSYRNLDSAYGCFLFIALVFCFGPVLAILPISHGDKEGLAMLLAIPIVFASFGVGIRGLVLAIIYREEAPLPIMAVAGILFLVSLSLDEDVMMAAAALYTLMIFGFCGRWFFSRRKKMKRAAAS